MNWHTRTTVSRTTALVVAILFALALALGLGACGTDGERGSGTPAVDAGSDAIDQDSRPVEPPESGTMLCAETCQFSGDGECDDGGEGAAFAECELGTDCADCGPRPASSLPVADAGAPTPVPVDAGTPLPSEPAVCETDVGTFGTGSGGVFGTVDVRCNRSALLRLEVCLQRRADDGAYSDTMCQSQTMTSTGFDDYQVAVGCFGAQTYRTRASLTVDGVLQEEVVSGDAPCR